MIATIHGEIKSAYRHRRQINKMLSHVLAQRGIRLAPSGMEQMGIELQNLYAALVQPREGLVVSYPTADVSGAELRPAFVVDRLLTLFPELRVEREESDKAYRLTAMIPALETAGTVPGSPLWRHFAADEALAPLMAAMERAAALKRGRLSRSAVRALYGERISMSASRVERLRSCHFAYFMEYGLKAKARRAAAFDAPQIGTDRKSTRLNSSHSDRSRMPSSA